MFDRTTRRVEPTAAGLALLPHARTMLAQVAAARDAVVRATRELSGSLRVGAEQCLGIVDVVSLLEEDLPADQVDAVIDRLPDLRTVGDLVDAFLALT